MILQTFYPQEEGGHVSPVGFLLRWLKVEEGFDLSLETKKKSIFIINQKLEGGFYGGAILYPSKVFDVPSYSQTGKPLV